MSKHEQGKNNKIEALRFLFCMLIVIMHINKTML
jgi:peptidoglycan/LPS O-acetylase OafA/YrhL